MVENCRVKMTMSLFVTLGLRKDIFDNISFDGKLINKGSDKLDRNIEEKMADLTSDLKSQMEESGQLDQEIKEQLRRIGYEL